MSRGKVHLLGVSEKRTRKEDWSLIMRGQARSRFLGSKVEERASDTGTREAFPRSWSLGWVSCLTFGFKALFSSFSPAPHFLCMPDPEHHSRLLL